MKICALQGGGCLGYGQALILAELEKRAGRPCSELFNLVAGTSVGSIIAACVATGVPASRIVEFFVKDAPEIFKSSFLGEIKALDGPKYGASQLEASLIGVLGLKNLSDCQIRLLATSYDFTSDRTVLFDSGAKSMSDANQIVFGADSPIPLWQICRASSAAQTYFPAFQYEDFVMLDGGNSGMNAPDMLAIVEALGSHSIVTDDLFNGGVKMLSLGSGDTAWRVNSGAMVNPSPIRAGLETIKLLFSAGEDAQISNARKLLGPHYYRLSPDLGNGIALDAAQECLNLIPAAVEKLVAVNQATLEEFC
jgi:hypothetical protein